MARRIDLLTIIGARPQIIKAAALHRAISSQFSGRLNEVILHTGQHYDDNMSGDLLKELELPPPDIRLHVGSASHGAQTAKMLEGIERAIADRRPDAVVIYGDTNSTLAGALAAAKMQVPVAHIEAGLRSYNKAMPEEINRIVSDHCSTWLFCPTGTAVNNLEKEGFRSQPSGDRSIDRPQVHLSGDVMYDNCLHFGAIADRNGRSLARLGVQPGEYFLVTMHRAGNTSDRERSSAIIETLFELRSKHGLDVIFPMHPRTRSLLDPGLLGRLEGSPGFHIIPPVGFFDMLSLEQHARVVITDSGGVQKEAYFFGRPSVILRAETEWTEIVEQGMAELADADHDRIMGAVDRSMQDQGGVKAGLFGDGRSAEKICRTLLESFAA